jgi:hypothetical protein
MPAPTGGTQTGQAGDGLVRITKLGLSPTIMVLGDDPLAIAQGSDFSLVDPGAIATDSVDGDLTTNIAVLLNDLDTDKLGSQLVVYSITNSSGLTATAIRQVVVVPPNSSARTAPEISLNGDNPLTIQQGEVYTELGAVASDTVDGDLSGNMIVSADDLDVATLGVYLITYTVTNSANMTTVATRMVEVIVGVNEFNYTGAVQTWTAPTTGWYLLETWGAQGGNALYGGRGGYSAGEVSLTAGQQVFVVVGEAGNTNKGEDIVGGYNGGGMQVYANNGVFGTGGGATHMALATGLLSETSVRDDILIVAGGGGGAGWQNAVGGVGGGTTGGNGAGSFTSYTIGQGGTQTAGGTVSGTSKVPYGTATAGSAGQGGTGVGYSGGGGGGGGGWYGGSGGAINSGGGGSGYIVGLANASTISGSATMPNPTGGTMTGRNGNGFARITRL